MTSLDWLSSMRPCSASTEKPPKTTEWIAPILAQASMAKTISGMRAHVDGDPVAFVDAHGLDDVGHAADLAVERVIGEGAVELAVLAFPDQGQLVLAIGLQMAVHGIVDDVDLAADEPLEEGLLRIVQDLVPFLEPFQFLGALGPETLQVGAGFLGERFPILDQGVPDDFMRWEIDLSFHFRVLLGYVLPSWHGPLSLA